MIILYHKKVAEKVLTKGLWLDKMEENIGQKTKKDNKNKMRLKNSSKRRFVGPVACVMALGFLGFSVIYPQIGSAYAAETKNPVENSSDGTIQVEVKEAYGEGVGSVDGSGSGQITVDVNALNQEGNVTDNRSETITVKVEEFLQITIPDAEEGATADVMMEADPTADGVTTSSSADFTVAGNNRNGFGVFVYAASNPDLSSDSTSVPVKPIAGSGVALDDFGLNKWGYNVTKADATESVINSYNPLAVRNETTAAYTINHPSAGENLKLNCGAKVDTSIPAGTYSTDVVISAVAPATNWGL